MPAIAVYSVKGGVGKTTLAANLAWCSAAVSCRKTLLWDLDAAGGAGFLMGVDSKKKKPAQSIFAQDRAPEKLIRRTPYDRLDLLPADETIRALDRQFAALGKRKRLAKLTAALAKEYPRIIFDCPPVLNEVSAQVMRAADIVIVPMPPSPLSTRAYEMVAAEVAENAGCNTAILPVLSMVDLRRNLHKQAVAQNPNWPVIPFASAIEQCAVRRQPLGAFAPRAPAQRHFRQLWTAIERKLAKR